MAKKQVQPTKGTDSKASPKPAAAKKPEKVAKPKKVAEKKETKKKVEKVAPVVAGKEKKTKTKAEPKVKGSKKKAVKQDEEIESTPLQLPTVSEDPTLSELSNNARKLEAAIDKKSKKKKDNDDSKKETASADETETDKDDMSTQVEKVKVKRQGVVNTGLSQKSDAKSYMSISNPSEDDKTIETPKLNTKKSRGIVYISHIPHGFYERQMRQFFSQFGTVTNLRLGRSKKSGKSQGYAFVEFKYQEVAKIVAETMNNYLMFEKLLKVELINPKGRSSKPLFAGKIAANRPPKMVQRVKAKKFLNSVKCEATDAKRKKRQQKNVDALHNRLKAAGIDYTIAVST